MRAIRTTAISILTIGLLAGSAVGVAAQEEAVPPVEFTAKWAFGSQLRSETSEAIDGGVQRLGGAWRPGVVDPASDPRWQGTLSVANNVNDYAASGGPTVGLFGFRIENEEGAWQQMPTVGLGFPDADHLVGNGVFVGEGEYEGLIAVVQVATDRAEGTWTLKGYIIDGELPPPPEPFMTE